MESNHFAQWLSEANHLTAPDTLMSRKEAAEYLGVKEQTLACWATTKRYDLPYIKIGRLVKYRRADVERFILENRFENGGAYV